MLDETKLDDYTSHANRSYHELNHLTRTCSGCLATRAEIVVHCSNILLAFVGGNETCDRQA